MPHVHDSGRARPESITVAVRAEARRRAAGGARELIGQDGSLGPPVGRGEPGCNGILRGIGVSGGAPPAGAGDAGRLLQLALLSRARVQQAFVGATVPKLILNGRLTAAPWVVTSLSGAFPQYSQSVLCGRPVHLLRAARICIQQTLQIEAPRSRTDEVCHGEATRTYVVFLQRSGLVT